MNGSAREHEDRELDRWIVEVTDAWRLPPRRGDQTTWSDRVVGPERQRPRLRGLAAGVASATVIVIAVVLVSVFVVGPPLGGPGSSPGTSQAAVRGPVGTARDDLFQLTVEVGKREYAAHEPISISTLLRYVGAADETLVTNSGSGLVGFSIEQVDGPFDPGGERNADCSQSRYRRGHVEGVPFSKSGGWSPSDPLADLYRAFFADPELRLPAGTYRITADAVYGVGECWGAEPMLAAAVQVVVTDPTSASEPGAWGQARDSLFELTIESDKARYAPEEPIGISTTLRYVGSASDATVTTFDGGFAAFGIEQLDGPIDAGPGRRPSTLGITFRPGYVASIPFVKPGGFVQDGPMAQFWQAFFADPELRLPAGTYRISAEAVYHLGDDTPDRSANRTLTPSIVVTVGTPVP